MRKFLRSFGQLNAGLALMLSLSAVSSAVGQQEPHKMPGMPQPSPTPSATPTPSPVASPKAAAPKTEVHPMPMASPSPSPIPAHTHMPGMKMPGEETDKQATSDEQMKGMNMSGGNSMSMGPLLLISGDDLGIRVGSSETNTMSMGAMGSGTSWQPISGPMTMYHKQSGDWLLMFIGMLSLG